MEKTQSLALSQERSAISWSHEEIQLIKSTVAKGATEAEFKVFLYVAKNKNLDPLKKQIYFRKQANGDVVHITSIDGYRATAARTGEYGGSDDAIFDDEQNPQRATVTVYRIVRGIRCAFSATARWHEYYPGDKQGFMWRKMPHLMLGKCAEALALRKAFPEELGGLYTSDEMEQAKVEDKSDVTSKIEDIRPPDEGRGETFNLENQQHKNWLWTELQKRNLSKEDAPFIAKRMHGRYEDELEEAIETWLVEASRL